MVDSKEIGHVVFGGYKAAVEAICKAVDLYAKTSGQSQEHADVVLFELAKTIKMKPDGRAAKFLDHFLFGNGASIEFDCSALIMEDKGVRYRIRTEIWNRLQDNSGLGYRNMSGGSFLIPIRQRDYQVLDWQFALGSFAIEWEVVEPFGNPNSLYGPVHGGRIDSVASLYLRSRSPGSLYDCSVIPTKVKIYGANEYKWHPAASRVTQCLHQAGDRLTKSRIKSMNFWMIARPCVIDLHTGLPSIRSC